MSDVALAAMRIRQVAGSRRHDEKIKQLWERAYRALVTVNNQWSRRRVRALWNREAMRVDHREIVEMEEVIAREARREHAAIGTDIARLEMLLRQHDEAVHSDQVAALRAARRALDRARTGGGK